MIIQAFGDIHARDTRPRVRTDDYAAELARKVLWALEEADGRGLRDRVILIPGDVFENCRASYRLMATVAELFRGRRVLVVPGQHDQRYHTSDLSNIPLMVLVRAGVFTLLNSSDDNDEDYGGFRFFREGVHFYGAGYGEEVPVPEKGWFNVLVTHRMVIKDLKLYPDQGGFVYSRTFLKEGGYDLIVSGDNHGKFTDEYEGKNLINAGSLMRSRIDQADHVPATFLFDTDTRDLEEVRIPVRLFPEVADLEAEEETDDINEKADEFAAALNDPTEDAEIDFVKNVQPYMDLNEVRPGVQSVIWEAVERAQAELEAEGKG